MAKVFLVDDDVDLNEMNKVVLEAKGHDVQVAFSAEEALKALETATPDIAVLDVMMEDDTAGFTLARALHEKFPTLPLLMLTGVREAKDITFKFEPDETWLPVAEFVEKPVTPDVLADKIATLLAKDA